MASLWHYLLQNRIHPRIHSFLGCKKQRGLLQHGFMFYDSMIVTQTIFLPSSTFLHLVRSEEYFCTLQLIVWCGRAFTAFSDMCFHLISSVLSPHCEERYFYTWRNSANVDAKVKGPTMCWIFWLWPHSISTHFTKTICNILGSSVIHGYWLFSGNWWSIYIQVAHLILLDFPINHGENLPCKEKRGWE